MTIQIFQQQILQGIHENLPAPKPYDPAISHAPKRNIDGREKTGGRGIFENISADASHCRFT